MAIILPQGLPARRTLESEGVAVVEAETRRSRGERALRVALLNLMPRKTATETQFARLLGSTPHLVELVLLVPGSHRSKTTPSDHIGAFYRPWSDVRAQHFDGLIVTGAPIETLSFEAIDYWQELTDVIDWAERAPTGSLFVCWAAQAALYHRHGVPKHALAEKAFGVFSQRVRVRSASLLRGFGESFPVPVSRHTEVRAEDLPSGNAIEVLADSPESGLCLLHEARRRAFYMFNHLEYDADTLRSEYLRDRAAGKPVQVPRNAFPQDDPEQAPYDGWRPYAHLLFRNWLDGLAAAAARQAGASRELAWLLRLQPGPATGTPGTAEFRLLARDELDCLPAILKALAAAALSPLAAKVGREEDGLLRIELRLDGMVDDRAERTARLLLKLDPVRRVAYRDGHAGGALVRESGAAAPSTAVEPALVPRSAAA